MFIDLFAGANITTLEKYSPLSKTKPEGPE
jgi:hypothetical protein